MSSEKEQRAAEMERRDRRNERLERHIMIFQGVLALYVAAGIAWWATGHYVLVPAWLAIVAVQAVTQIYGQKTIRRLRRANREAYQRIALLHEQYAGLVDAFRLGGPKADPW